MDFGKAFTFMGDDPDWVSKLAIGALVVLITPFLLGIPVILLVGYQIAMARQVMRGETDRLPAWDNIGQLFMDGLNVVIALLVYSAPAWILLCIGFAAFALPAFSGGDEELAGALAGIGFGIYALMLCLVILFALVLGIVAPGIYIQYVRTGELGALFRFGEVLDIVRDNLGDVVLAWLAYFVANLLLQLVTAISIITICGPIILGLVGPVWLLIVAGHLYGQIGAKAGYSPA